MSFIEKPNLPAGRVRTCIVSAREPAIIKSLGAMGITCLSSYDKAGCENAVAAHADVNALHLGNGEIVIGDSCEALEDTLISLGLNVKIESLGDREYPKDCALNALIVGNCVFCREELCSQQVKSHCDNIHNVRQGYTKCSTAVVDENAFITSDIGIYGALKSMGYDVLKITGGEIALRGYDTGLIGGTCAKLAKDILCFSGKIDDTSFGSDIRAFCRSHGIYIETLTEMPLFDFGGIVAFEEE
ncbi:MAG: hypothetical protein RR235_09335 [Oscillospiraceae bacterium]